jgi:hypothetical protein
MNDSAGATAAPPQAGPPQANTHGSERRQRAALSLTKALAAAAHAARSTHRLASAPRSSIAGEQSSRHCGPGVRARRAASHTSARILHSQSGVAAAAAAAAHPHACSTAQCSACDTAQCGRREQSRQPARNTRGLLSARTLPHAALRRAQRACSLRWAHCQRTWHNSTLQALRCRRRCSQARCAADARATSVVAVPHANNAQRRRARPHAAAAFSAPASAARRRRRVKGARARTAHVLDGRQLPPRRARRPARPRRLVKCAPCRRRQRAQQRTCACRDRARA